MKYVLVLYITCFLSFYSFSQFDCDTADVLANPCLDCDIKLDKDPCFSTLDTIGCVPFEVKMIDCSGSCLPRYIYVENPDSIVIDSIHIYRTPGIFDVTQLIGTDRIERLTKPNLIRAVSSSTPIFKVNHCKDRKVVLTFDDENLYDKYIINYGDGSPVDTITAGEEPEKSYTDAAPKTITVKGFYNNAPCSATATATAFPQLELTLPEINTLTTTKLSADSGEVAFNIVGSSFFGFEIYQSTNYVDFSLVKSFSTSSNADTTVIIPGLNTLDSSYCFYFITIDLCGNFLASDTICSLSIQGEALNNQNKLTWLPYPYPTQFDSIDFIKNNLTTTLSTSESAFTDTTIICGNYYCYQLKASPKQNNDITLYSNTLCIEGISEDTPIPISDFQSSYLSNNQIILWWKSPSPYIVKNTFIQLSQELGPFLPLTKTTDFDSSYSYNILSSGSFCYIINYEDFCNNASDVLLADTSCPILLNVNQVNENEFELQWSSYIGFNSLNYTIQYLSDSNEVYNEIVVGSNLSYNDKYPASFYQKIRYRIKAQSATYEYSYSNTVEYELKARSFMPNAFSPDGDNINDYFKPNDQFIQTYELSIFNRWGELIFYEKDSELGWDGRYKDELVPNGTYVFIMNGTDFSGNQIERKGTVTVYY